MNEQLKGRPVNYWYAFNGFIWFMVKVRNRKEDLHKKCWRKIEIWLLVEGTLKLGSYLIVIGALVGFFLHLMGFHGVFWGSCDLLEFSFDGICLLKLKISPKYVSLAPNPWILLKGEPKLQLMEKICKNWSQRPWVSSPTSNCRPHHINVCKTFSLHIIKIIVSRNEISCWKNNVK